MARVRHSSTEGGVQANAHPTRPRSATRTSLPSILIERTVHSLYWSSRRVVIFLAVLDAAVGREEESSRGAEASDDYPSIFFRVCVLCVP